MVAVVEKAAAEHLKSKDVFGFSKKSSRLVNFFGCSKLREKDAKKKYPRVISYYICKVVELEQ